MSRAADYVIVGSGSSGSIIARRLADSGASVLLLEKAHDPENVNHGSPLYFTCADIALAVGSYRVQQCLGI